MWSAMRDGTESAPWKTAFAVVVLAAIVRILALAAFADIPTVNDENIHLSTAANIAVGEPVGDAAGKAPGATLFYALLAWVFGPSVLAVRLGNIAVSSLTAGLLCALGHRIGGNRAAIASGVAAALYPNLIGFSHYLWAENLYVFFVVAATLAIAEDLRSPAFGKRVIAGAALGLAVLTREVGIVLLGALAVGIWWNAGLRNGAARAAVVVAVASVVILPWSFHLQRATGGFALVTTTTWLNLYVGNENPGDGGPAMRPLLTQYYALAPTHSERNAEARRRTLAAIANRMPWWPLEKLVELRDLMSPTSIPVRRLLAPPANSEVRRIGFGEWRYEFAWTSLGTHTARVLAAFVVIGSYVVVAMLGIAGLVLMRDRRSVVLVSLVILAHVAPAVLAFGTTRFRLPIEPFLLLPAAWLLSALPAVWREASVGRRRAAFAGAVGMALLIEAGRNLFLSPHLV